MQAHIVRSLLLTFAAAAALTGCRTTTTAAPVPAAPVAGALTSSAWQLAEVGGMQAGGKQFMQFDTGKGMVHGSGGCNNFSGSYAWSGKSLKVGPLASTRRACLDEPTGRQEMAMLKALEATRTWRVEGKTLVLSGEQGQLARFTAQ